MTTQVTAMKRPFAPPAHLPPGLERVQAYWRGLLRGSAQIPFYDDYDPTALPDLRRRIFLIGVYAKPERYRFEQVGGDLRKGLEGLFADEIQPTPPFEFLVSQAHATTEASAPTAFHDGERPYVRLLLPMWGDGRIGMLLGAVEWD
ncbi:MAG: hypothetical protein ACM3W4_07390 [Ignavibacteriales bacterium]